MSYEGLGNGGEGRPPAAATGLARQSSIYSLTLGEFQHTLEGLGKDFGSMNMDEFLKSIWFAEETQAIASAVGFGGETSYAAATAAGGTSGTTTMATALQRQGSLTLPRTISLKTVDEVWRDIAREETTQNNSIATATDGNTDADEQKWQASCFSTYGEMTLEEFLVKAGVVREEVATVTDGGLFGGFPVASGGDNRAFARVATTASAGNGVAVVVEKAGASPRQQQTSCYDAAVQVVGSSVDICGGAGDAGASTGVGRYAGGSPSSSGDLMLPSSSCGFSKEQGRRAGGVEKAVERRQKRMIKNRESAARSRARKQAYTMELEAEVAKLKEKNQELMTKQAKILEIQKKQILESSNKQEGTKKRKLRRTQTGPW